MSLKYGFYNSASAANPDRLYSVEDFGEVLGSFVSDGIFENYGSAFAPSYNGTSKVLTIGTGKAWIKNTWCFNNPAQEFTISSELLPGTGNYRLYAVAIKVDKTARENSFIFVNSDSKTTQSALWSSLYYKLQTQITNQATQFLSILAVVQIFNALGSYAGELIDMRNMKRDDPTYGTYIGWQNIHDHYKIVTESPAVDASGLSINGVALDPDFNNKGIGRYGGLELDAVTRTSTDDMIQSAGDIMYDNSELISEGKTKLYCSLGDTVGAPEIYETTIANELSTRLPYDGYQSYRCLYEDHESYSSGGVITFSCPITAFMARIIRGKNGDYYPRKISITYETYNGMMTHQTDTFMYSHDIGNTYRYMRVSSVTARGSTYVNQDNGITVTFNQTTRLLTYSISRETTINIPYTNHGNPSNQASAFVVLEW